MIVHFHQFVGALFALLVVSSALAQDVIKIDPRGNPKGLTKGNAIRYFVWHNEKGWHVRSDTGGKRHTFSGTIEIVGGKVESISNFDNLESGAKKRNADIGQLNKDKNKITFQMVTSDKRDGFDFQVDAAATEVRFKLLIDGKPAPDRTLIGRESDPAPGDTFAFPASP